MLLTYYRLYSDQIINIKIYKNNKNNVIFHLLGKDSLRLHTKNYPEHNSTGDL